MSSINPEPPERRAAARWEHLSQLTGVSLGGKQTGWDRLIQQIFDDPDLRLKAVHRMEAIVNLCRLLTRSSEAQFTVLALRLGLTVDDQIVAEQSRRQVSERLQLSMSRIAQLEQEALLDLRRRAAIEFPNMAHHVHRVAAPTQLQQTG
jgi:DNA-directed RNA polymerase sigma subunit (sigma70/sigma32)